MGSPPFSKHLQWSQEASQMCISGLLHTGYFQETDLCKFGLQGIPGPAP